MKKCPNCGTTENDEAKFCLNCGHELIADNKIESGQSATNVTQNIAVKKKSKGIIAVIIILITIIIILGILVFFLVSNSSSKKEDDNFKISEEIDSGEEISVEDEEQTGYKVNNPELSRVVDDADVLTDSEERSLSDKINNLISKYGYDLVIVTTNSTGSKTYEECAEDYYYEGYGVGSDNDGALMLVNAETSEWYITATDNLKNKFTRDDLNDTMYEIDDASKSYFTKREYGKAFDVILDKVDIVLNRLSTNSLEVESSSVEEVVLESENKEKIISNVQAGIDEFFAVYDYEGAYNYLNEMVNTYYDVAELKNMLNNLETSFKDYLMENAKDEFESKNYETAVSILSAGINVLGEEDADLNNIYNEYKSYIPTYINELEYFNKNEDCMISIDDNNDIKDNTGHEYRHCYFLHDWDDNEEDWVEYLINGNYNTFSGTVGVSYNQRDTDLTKYFEIYGDGKLLYTSPSMTSGSMPEKFSIDITGVKVLKIWYPPSKGTNAMAMIYEGLLTRND